MVVSGEIPAARVDDEPERAQVAPRGLAGVGAVGQPHAPPAADGVGEHEDGLARDRRTGGGAGSEPERSLERLDLAAEIGRQDAVDLLQRPRGRPARGVQPEPPRGEEAEHDDDRLVVSEHERRQPVARAHSVAAADPALALDRDPQLLENGQVSAHRARVDAKAVGDLPPGHDRAGLEQLEELEEVGGRRAHASSVADIEGGNRPILPLRWAAWNRRWEAWS